MGINLRLLCRKEHKTVAIFGRKVMYNRITILGIVVLFLLSLDVARIFYLQVLKGDEYAAKAESQQLSDTEIPAMRGTIYDSDGNILAQSATVWTVYLDPLNIKEKQRPVLIAELTKLFDLDEEEAKAKGLLKIIGNKEVDDDYIAQVKTLCIQPELLAEEGSKLSIVYTPIHGSGNVPVRRILREVGISNVSVVKEQELPDPNFSTVKVPNPEDPGAFVLAIKLADEVGAKVIFATDPDCDRLGVAVKTGNGDWQLLTGNQIGCVLLHYILSTKQKQGTLPKNGAAVKSIVSTSLANKIAASFGVEMFETLTGFKFIGEKIQQFQDTGSHTFLFGFEESYGFLSSTFVRDKDGVNASLLIAEVACACAAQGITLYDYVQSIFREYGYFVEKVVSKTLPGKDGLSRMKEIMKELRENPPKELCGMKVTAIRDYLKGTRTADGKVEPTGLPKSDVLYFELEKGNWVCVRPSGTEPKIKLYVNTNASDKADAEKLNADLRVASEALLD